AAISNSRLPATTIQQHFLLASHYANAVLSESIFSYYCRFGGGPHSFPTRRSSDLNGTYKGGVTLGQSGALVGDLDTAVGFDGSRAAEQTSALQPASDFASERLTRLNSGASGSPYANNTLYGGYGTVRLIVRPNGFY